MVGPDVRPGSGTNTRITGVVAAPPEAAAERDGHQDLGAAVDVVDPGLTGLAGLDAPGRPRPGCGPMSWRLPG